MSQKIWVDFAYMLEHKQARQRNMRWTRLRGRTLVDIPEAGAFDTTEALVESYARNVQPRHYGGRTLAPRTSAWSKGNLTITPGPAPGKETLRTSHPGYGGRLYRELKAPYDMDDDRADRFQPLTLAHIQAEHGPHTVFRDHPFLKQEDFTGLAGLKTREEFVDVNLKETGRDYEEMGRRIAAETAARMLVVDGKVHMAQVEPVYIVTRQPNRVSIEWERPYRNCRAHGVPFPLHRYEDALSFARALASEAGLRKVDEPYRKVDRVDPAYLGLQMPAVTATLLAAGAVHLVKEFKDHRGAARGVLDEIHESVGGGARGVIPGVAVGDPYDFADRLGRMGVALGEVRTDRWDMDAVNAVAARIKLLSEPFRVHKDLGLAPETPAMAGEDLDSLSDLVDDFVMPGPGF